MEFDGGYLDDPKCPYPTELKAYLRRLVGPVRAGRDDLTSMIEPMLGDESASGRKRAGRGRRAPGRAWRAALAR